MVKSVNSHKTLTGSTTGKSVQGASGHVELQNT